MRKCVCSGLSVSVCGRARARACECARTCGSVRVRACVRACVCVVLCCVVLCCVVLCCLLRVCLCASQSSHLGRPTSQHLDFQHVVPVK